MGPFYLWTPEAVQQFLAERFELWVSVWTVERYLKKWSFTPHKPLRRAYEQDSRTVKRWLEAEYPQICASAQREGAEIHWGDEMRLRSDDRAGRSYGRVGQTPEATNLSKSLQITVIRNGSTLQLTVKPEELPSTSR